MNTAEIIKKALYLAKFGKAYTSGNIHVSITKDPLTHGDWISVFYMNTIVFMAVQNGNGHKLNGKTWKVDLHTPGDWEVSLMNARKSKKFKDKV